MIKTGRAGGFFRLASLAFCFAMSLSLPGLSQTPASQNPYQPLPQDTGVLGLKQELLRLQTTARLMQVVAHPDDEDGGMQSKQLDRKSTRLNSSHLVISYAVFCL